MTSSSMGDLSRPRTHSRLFSHFLGVLLALTTWLSVPARAHAQGSRTSSIDRDAFLRAISEVESGGNSRAVGPSGERGMFQFRRSTWRQYTRRSFYEAHKASVATAVAAKHFEWLLDGFYRNGRTPTPYLVAAAWNAGLSKTLSGNMPRATRDYARRVSNIVASLSQPPAPVGIRRFVIAAAAE